LSFGVFAKKETSSQGDDNDKAYFASTLAGILLLGVTTAASAATHRNDPIFSGPFPSRRVGYRRLLDPWAV
jgi:hypothetical protein